MGRNVGLSQGIIVTTGLELTAQVGLASVTLQRLGDELGVSAEAIAYYFSRRRLHAEIAGLALEEVRYPLRSEGTWEDRLRTQAYSWQEVMQRYPGVQGLVSAYPGLLPGVRRLMDQGLNDLIDSGFDDATAKLLYGHYHAFMVGWNVVRSVPAKTVTTPSAGPVANGSSSSPSPGGAPGRGSHAWTRADPLFDFAVASHLEMMRMARRGDWLPEVLGSRTDGR